MLLLLARCPERRGRIRKNTCGERRRIDFFLYLVLDLILLHRLFRLRRVQRTDFLACVCMHAPQLSFSVLLNYHSFRCMHGSIDVTALYILLLSSVSLSLDSLLSAFEVR